MHAQLIRSVKNAKLFTETLSPSRPAIYLPICIRNKHAASQNAKNNFTNLHAFEMPD